MKKYLLLVLPLGLVGCVSMSSVQTARTLPEGQTQQSFGGGVYNSTMNVAGTDVETNMPYFEYSYRRGFTDKIDAGLKLTFVGAYSADGKYQFYSDDKWAISAGAGVGYMSYKITSGNNEEDVKFLDLMLPLYLSYDVSPSFSVYTSPKLISRQVSGTDSKSEAITGLTLGTKIGEKSGVYAEATLIKGQDSQTMTQYNLSYFW